MPKPDNPYRKGFLIWAVMEGDWGDLTPVQIAEVLSAPVGSIRVYIKRIKTDTGYEVPHIDGRSARYGEE